VAATYVQVWEVVAGALAELDVLVSFAQVATHSPSVFVRPEMLGAEEGVLSLKGSRHPCLELQEGVDFICNDCDLVRGESWFQLITGPNMGGKSTYIRQVPLTRVTVLEISCALFSLLSSHGTVKQQRSEL
jgi:DNA mismatch repair protein MSH2